MNTFVLIGVLALVAFTIILWIRARKKKKKQESQLGIFHHPSNFKKAPVEWVQQPKKEKSEEETTLRIDKSS